MNYIIFKFFLLNLIDSFVASIFINCDPNQLKELYDNPKDGKINAEVIYAR